MKIAFITSAYRTVFFYAIAEKLEILGHKVYWISPNRRWAKWLIDHNVPKEQILDITRYGNHWTSNQELSTDEFSDLLNLEQCSKWNINNLIMMDPLLSRRKYNYSLKYLAVCQKHIGEFLLSNEIKMVFGERAWAIELVTDQLCQKLGILYLLPDYARVLNGRFVFLDGPIRNQMTGINNTANKDFRRAETIINSFRKNKPSPSYMRASTSVLKCNKQRLFYFYCPT